MTSSKHSYNDNLPRDKTLSSITTGDSGYKAEIQSEGAMAPVVWTSLAGVILFLLSAYYLTSFGSVSFVLISWFWIVVLALLGCYQVTLNKIIALSMWKTDSAVGKKLSSRFIWYIFSFLIAMMIMPVSLVAISGSGVRGFVTVSISATLSLFIMWRFTPILNTNLKKKYAQKFQIIFAIGLPAIFVPILVNILFFVLGEDSKSVDSFSEILAIESLHYAHLESCPLALYIGKQLAWISSLSEVLMSKLPDALYAVSKIVLNGDSLIAPQVSAIAIFLSLPFAEMKRIFSGLEENSHQPTSDWHVFWWSFCLTIMFIGIYIPLFAFAKGSITGKDENIKSLIDSVETTKEVLGDFIDGKYYKSGTREQLKILENELIAQSSMFKARIDRDRESLRLKINILFDRKISNTDKFLDDYYSLWSEYARIAEMAMGNIEYYMQKKLESSLIYGLENVQDDIDSLSKEISAAEKEWESFSQTFRERRSKILSDNELPNLTAKSRIFVFSSTDSVDGSNYLFNKEIRIGDKLFGTGVGGTMGAMIATKIGGKIASKAIFKTAAKTAGSTALKMAGGGFAGASAGATAGAAAGSVFPGPGTAIGGIVGGIAGAIGGVLAVDKIILELEQLVYREDFRREIVTAIEAQRTETLKALGY